MLVKLLILLTPLVCGCTFPAWRDQVYADLMTGRLRLDYGSIGPVGSRSETVELYGADGRRLGYGRVSGGTLDLYDAGSRRIGYGVIRGGSVDFYNVDGSRTGYSKIGR